MKTFNNLLLSLRTCDEALEWVGEKTIEEAVAQCRRGEWLLWIAHHIGIDKRARSLAKTRCVEPVAHLMTDHSKATITKVKEFLTGDATEEDIKELYIAPVDVPIYMSAFFSNDTRIQVESADICREVLGDLIINKVNEMLNEK